MIHITAWARLKRPRAVKVQRRNMEMPLHSILREHYIRARRLLRKSQWLLGNLAQLVFGTNNEVSLREMNAVKTTTNTATEPLIVLLFLL